ncbi:hypothetical protein HNQ96_006194 [Aminobacter lissarensis]|uniref:Uncharacterized protein n=1 Tax=Aminobacter carboxidus TaxID=376165 RepID=A0A8E1WKL1_9HYPH|nr:hypothetical protein [Aminobacter lissarensis]MBB6470297.1 hypothetical protein [Aminobacter lissarensis]
MLAFATQACIDRVLEQQARFFEARFADRLRHVERLHRYQPRIGLEGNVENALLGAVEIVSWAMLRDELANE